MSDLPTDPYDVDRSMSELVKLQAALASRDMDARLVASLRARGEYDSGRHGVLDTTPLTEAEHIAVLACGAAIARLAMHPAYVHYAVRAGVPWEKIAVALGQTEAEARAAYVRWANGQRHLAIMFGDQEVGVTERDIERVANDG